MMAKEIEMTVLTSHQRGGVWVKPGDRIKVSCQQEAVRLEASKRARRDDAAARKASGK